MPITRQTRQTLLVAAALAGLTAFHAGYRHLSGAPSASQTSGLSGFAPGKPLPPLVTRPLASRPGAASAAPAAGACRLVVLFSPTCEHCHTAARRDVATPDSLRLPVLWVSHSDDPGAAAFADALKGVSPVVYGGPDAFQAMDVRGVPAAFLVSTRGIVQWIGGYMGGAEYHAFVKEKC